MNAALGRGGERIPAKPFTAKCTDAALKTSARTSRCGLFANEAMKIYSLVSCSMPIKCNFVRDHCFCAFHHFASRIGNFISSVSRSTSRLRAALALRSSSSLAASGDVRSRAERAAKRNKGRRKSERESKRGKNVWFPNADVHRTEKRAKVKKFREFQRNAKKLQNRTVAACKISRFHETIQFS